MAPRTLLLLLLAAYTSTGALSLNEIFRVSPRARNEVRPGDSVTLDCVASYSVKCGWELQGTQLSTNFFRNYYIPRDLGITARDPNSRTTDCSITLLNVDWRYSGKYTCFAESTPGGRPFWRSQAAEVIVVRKPDRVELLGDDIRESSLIVSGEQPTTVSCRVTNALPKADIFWYINKKQLLEGIASHDQSAGGLLTTESRLTHQFTEEDRGARLRCVAFHPAYQQTDNRQAVATIIPRPAPTTARSGGSPVPTAGWTTAPTLESTSRPNQPVLGAASTNIVTNRGQARLAPTTARSGGSTVPTTAARPSLESTSRRNPAEPAATNIATNRGQDEVPDITTVHTHFRSSGGNTYVECHVGDRQLLQHVQIYRINRINGHAQLLDGKIEHDGGYAIVKSEREALDPPQAFLCRLDYANFSNVTSLEFSGTAYYEPSGIVYRANDGETVRMSDEKSADQPVWTRYRSDIPLSPRFTSRGQELVGTNVTADDTGIYVLSYGSSTAYSAATRLIVRRCPANFFGSDCTKRCPFCLHGGQCHDVTGQCVCPPGFTGTRCQTACKKNEFGRACSSKCPKNGAERTCWSRLLCVPDPYGCSCASGYTGQYCNQECSEGRYGPDCAFECSRHCNRGRCNAFTGYCGFKCASSKVRLPLCQEDQWPWFRDPPAVLEVGFNHLVIEHLQWSSEYDNGFSDGPYRYIAQYRRDGTTADWITPEQDGIDHVDGTENKKVQFNLTGLEAGATYQARIVVTDTTLDATQESDMLLSANVTTKCNAPGAVGSVQLDDLTATSVTVILQPLVNERTACQYQLNLTVTSAKDGMLQYQKTLAGKGSQQPNRLSIPDLIPYTDYKVTVYAKHQKGSGPESEKTFTTKQAAPSGVRKLTAKHRSGGVIVEWDPPARENGIIKGYVITTQHTRYLACRSNDWDRKDVMENTTRKTSILLTLKHGYSEYSVAVAGRTVALGPQEITSHSSKRRGPSDDIKQLGRTTGQTYLTLSWSWPSCEHWQDEENNLRLDLKLEGKSSWNIGLQKSQNITRRDPRVSDLTPFSDYSVLVHFCNSVSCFRKPHNMTVKTKPSSEPGAPLNMTILEVSSTSLTVGWSPPSPPLSPISAYKVSHKGPRFWQSGSYTLKEDEACSFNLSSRSPCRARVEKLLENTNYTITVIAVGNNRNSKSSSVIGLTREGVPGEPKELKLSNRTTSMLTVSWLEPEQKNGRLIAFRLNVSLENADTERRPKSAAFRRSFEVPVLHREDRSIFVDHQYAQVIPDLEAGRRYLVSVAANTSAGYGAAASALLETEVERPRLQGAPRVAASRTTDTTVQLELPEAHNSGGPVTTYLVVVSTDPQFDGAPLSARPRHLPSAAESQTEGLNYYVTAALQPARVSREKRFVVGDGKYYNSGEKEYHNRPLTTGAEYRLGVAALSRLSEDNQKLVFQPIAGTVVAEKPIDAGLVAGLIVLILLVAMAILGTIVCWKQDMIREKITAYRQNTEDIRLQERPAIRQRIKDEVQDPEDFEDEEVVYQNLQPDQINFTRVAVSDLVETTRRDIETGLLKMQLQSLPHGMVHSCSVGEKPENKRKNRYINLLPYDSSRVLLHKMPGDECSDYINANYVAGYNRPHAYIACQGPKKETVFDFWRMVWQEKAQRIVMLTNLVESGKLKCNLYWPEKEPLEMPGMTVLKDSENVFSDYVVRNFSVVKDGETRSVVHLHYTAWPDHSVPAYPASLAKFIKVMNSVHDGEAPTVVHCSAGVGRTGTVILIDAMYQMGRQEQAVDVYSHLTVMRQQRANLCANAAQYQLVHEVLVQLLVSPSSAVPAAELATLLPQLRARDGGPSQLECQLQHLDANRPRGNYATLQGQKLEAKNRSPDVLPDDSSRVFLDPSMPDNYVNAVYVQGFNAPDAFIATEAPLPTRKYIFWQMVAQKHSRTIVVMNDLMPGDKFWPAKGQTEVYRDLVVQNKEETVSGNIKTITLVLKTYEADQTQTQAVSEQRVCLLVLSDGSGLPAASSLLQLHSAYVRCAARSAKASGDPVVVVSRDGVSGCGLFLTVCFELDHLSEEQELDVMMAVSVVRRSRPQFITGLDQFDLCYEVALLWLEAFATYANFQ